MWSGRRSFAAEDDVQAAAAAVAAMRGPDRGDFRGMTRDGQPVMDRSPDSTPLDRWIAGPRMAGDQQHDPLAALDRTLERDVDGAPRSVEVVAVKVDDTIG